MTELAEVMTLFDALEKYRATISILKKGASQEKFRIASLSRSWMAEKWLHEVTSVDIARYRDERLSSISERTRRTISASTVRLEMALLSHVFEIGKIEWGACRDNPVKLVRKPKIPPGRSRRLTPREEKKIMRYAAAHQNPELLSIIIVALETAMRQGEILSMRWENIDLAGRVANLPHTKNGETRDVPLSLKARDALVSLGVRSEGAVFSYKPSGLKSTWKLMLKRLEIHDLHFHDMRHEAISRLFELGTLDAMEVSAISGHKSMSMLKRYTHLKARKLVQKLEGGRSKARLAVVGKMVPYPAVVTNTNELVSIEFLDIPGLSVRCEDRATAEQRAEDTLMRYILQALREGRTIPKPDEYLTSPRPGQRWSIVMIDPLRDRA